MEGTTKGFLIIVLHAHLPFVRHPEHEDFLEEYWLHEAITETYIPLLLLMERLLEEGVDFRLAMSLTPPLASMLEDPLLQFRYLKRLEGLIGLAGREIERTRGSSAFHSLARMYHARLSEVREAYATRYGRDLVGAFRRIQDTGRLEILASAATHGYLPLLSVNDCAVRAQIQIGVDHHRRLFGEDPRGFWLPECGYHPQVEAELRRQGVRYTILETHGITRADPRPQHGVYAPVYGSSGLAFFGRDPKASRQVWSSVDGYPGDYDYREFYRDVGFDEGLDYLAPHIHRDGIRTDTGIKYYRITGPGNHKEVYVPEWAEKKAELHAQDFMFHRLQQLDHLASSVRPKPVIVAPYDAELLGHWWYEGLRWLEHLIRKIASDECAIRLLTPSEYLEMFPTHQVVSPSISSWGYKGYNEVWLSGSNDWIYPHLHHAAITMERLARSELRARGCELRALNQAARELLLAQASDWAFMIKSGTTHEYAARRTRTHLARHQRICREIENGAIRRGWLSEIERLDNIFPDLDYRSFA